MRVTVLLAVLMMAPVFAGCLSDSELPEPNLAPGEYVHPDLADVVWDTTNSWSVPVTAPLYDRLDSVIEQVPSFDGTPIEIGIFRPDIPGCPTELDATEYPDECKTPVVIDAGPYFSPTSIGVESTRPPTAIWLVPYGYTVVQLAIRGTGGSGGCMEFMSLNEQKDVDHVVTDLATRAWSTGNIGMIGRSYDGTTPFYPAALGNPHLKTIVPISGVTDVPDLMFSNGTSEFRGPIMHSVVYWVNYGIGAEPVESTDSQVCQELALGQAAGAYTAVTGDWSVADQSDYWQVRQFRERILENYNGSAYIIHGMQDWNVNPRMVVPWINELQDSGIKTKAWLGQWGHAYPDRADEHPNTRWDWAETLLRWFDSELKGMDVDTGPIVEVEDHRHDWWAMDSYPSRELEWFPLYLNGDGSMTNTSAGGDTPAPVVAVLDLENVQSVSYTSEPIEGPVRVSGLVRLALEVTPTSPAGSNIVAQLHDVYPDGRSVWIGQAWMNLEYHEGGNERQTLVPGQPVIAKMEFEPLEAFLPDGHRLRLSISQECHSGPCDVIAEPQRGPFAVHTDGDSILKLPLVTDFTKSPYDDPNA